MPPKGKRKGAPKPRPLSPVLARKRKHPDNEEPTPPSRWSWVKLDGKVAEQITPKHMIWACGFSEESGLPVCPNIWSKDVKEGDEKGKGRAVDTGAYDASVSGKSQKAEVIDLTLPTLCSKKKCRDNPNCLNYLGQDAWEDEDEARAAFLQVARLGYDPRELNRDPEIPVGLRNLGATCYANAFIQVWFQDLAFRAGVYACKPTAPEGKQLEDAPLFQLQATFAALQQCRQNIYNPIKLVESLGLRTSEQQDATEFSKLFMNLLGEQFKLQEAPSVKTLLRDQFEGHLTYCTTCKGCGHTSERDSEFLELELNLGSKSHLEERILEVLQKEELTDDNKYMCSRCNSLKNATRWVKLRDCPPVLHFPLMRFVYDIKTYERKKSKQVIQFPLSLNMKPFLNGGAYMDDQIYDLRGVLLHRGLSAYHGHYIAQAYDVSKGQWFQFNDEEVSPLDGLMGGNSATAAAASSKSSQTSKENKSTNITSIVESEGGIRPKFDEEDERPVPIQDRGKEKVEHVVELLDDEVEPEPSEHPIDSSTPNSIPRYLRSKDAYMLIYARRDVITPADVPECPLPGTSGASAKPDCNTPAIPPVPLAAQREVDRLNEEHDRKCDEYVKREQVVLETFSQVRAVKQEIYSSWNIQTHDDDSVVVNAEQLTKWLGQGLDVPKQPIKETENDIEVLESLAVNAESGVEATTPGSSETPRSSIPPPCGRELENIIPTAPNILPENEPEPIVSDADSSKTLVSSPPVANPAVLQTNWLQGTLTSDSLCEHGLIVPPATSLKRINQAAYMRLLSLGVIFEPALAHTAVCPDCTEHVVSERIYGIRHPELVKVFQDQNIIHSPEDVAYWVSKQWLKDWLSSRPKMHAYGQLDPPPNAEPWKNDLVCEHEGLKISEKDRKLVSAQAYRLLRTIYPGWETFSNTVEVCVVCQEAEDLTSDARADARKAADRERSRLRSMLSINPLASRPVSLIEGFVYAVVPSAFIRAWRSWLIHPLTNSRPTSLDTSIFFCPHEKIYFDSNEAVDMEDVDLVVIKESEWNILAQLYPAGQMIRLEPTTHIDENETVRNVVICNQEVCQQCRRERKSSFEEAPVTMYFMDITDPLPIGNTPNSEQPNAPSASNADDLDIVSVSAQTGKSSPVKSESTLDAYVYGTSGNYDGGLRKSKRLRATKQRGMNRTIIIRKGDTVKDIKVELFDQFNIPTIYQRLFHAGREITDWSDKTVADIGILAQDTISVLEVKPVDEDDDEGGRPKKKRREEGPAFGGTLLSRGGIPPPASATAPAVDTNASHKPDSMDSSHACAVAEALCAAPRPPDSNAPTDLADFEDSLHCPTCTFINPAGVSACTMCDTPFAVA
ncbi:hypothetical protein DACRYDRAFT_103677 [Dacryopinax primogenitus]|uniref:Uncharacterized protein n=1 Tax=Dacryopinax primogenitus (strain DJM 731) TaxID=1858805 RepID=M5GGB2_DACPD|nr:uncharacterized protein DACRYDRAFT_103677 [Dacryopinax primogenitus]EJU05183.1 hypothetical protein DACRYDRAFT_103677 [Dacryopinax primogenitus]